MNKRQAVIEYIKEYSATPATLIQKAYFDSEKYDEFQEIIDLNAYFGVDEINEDEGHYFDSYLPMWATLWRVSNICDYDYIIDHTKEVSEAGFRIYYDENDDELYLGIDGCGYDFIDAHWSKLYDLKGMKWHDESEAA